MPRKSGSKSPIRKRDEGGRPFLRTVFTGELDFDVAKAPSFPVRISTGSGAFGSRSSVMRPIPTAR